MLELGKQRYQQLRLVLLVLPRYWRWNQIGGQTGNCWTHKIGNQVRIQAQSGIILMLKTKKLTLGSPAISAGDYRRNYVHFRNLTEIVKKNFRIRKKNQKE